MTEELIRWHKTPLTAAPVFPSTYEEGQEDRGYDVELKRPGVPLLIQYKLSELLNHKNAKQYRNGKLKLPYFKMHLRPLAISQQHVMLQEWERKGNEVRYAAPIFISQTELDAHYMNNSLLENSIWIEPSAIGDLPDDRPHYLAFESGSTPFLCSEPTLIKTEGSYTGLVERLIARLNSFGNKDAFQMGETLLNQLKEISLIEYLFGRGIKNLPRRWDELHPLKQSGVVAQSLSASKLYWVTLKND